MSVIAKFKVDAIERMGYKMWETNSEGEKEIVLKELNTIKMSPVSGNGDPNHENTKFWQASPTGSFVLGTVNPAAVAQFELGEEYYIEIRKVQ